MEVNLVVLWMDTPPHTMKKKYLNETEVVDFIQDHNCVHGIQKQDCTSTIERHFETFDINTALAKTHCVNKSYCVPAKHIPRQKKLSNLSYQTGFSNQHAQSDTTPIKYNTNIRLQLLPLTTGPI